MSPAEVNTYRLMAEETVDLIVNALNRSQVLSGTVGQCRTAQVPLLPKSETERVSGILHPRSPARSSSIIARMNGRSIWRM